MSLTERYPFSAAVGPVLHRLVACVARLLFTLRLRGHDSKKRPPTEIARLERPRQRPVLATTGIAAGVAPRSIRNAFTGRRGQNN